LFGRDVLPRPGDNSHLCFIARPRIDDLCNAEIDQFDMLFSAAQLFEHDIFRLEIPVKDALLMRGMESASGLPHETRRVSQIHRPLVHDFTQRPSIDEFHHEEGAPIFGIIAVNDAHDPRMINAGQGFGFLRKFSGQPFVLFGGVKQKFDHHVHSVQSLVTSQKNHADPATP
jgi:hypothetical protein